MNTFCKHISSVYFLVHLFQILIYRGKEIMEVTCEMSAVHSILTSLPHDLPYDNLISNAYILIRKFPPRKLRPLVLELSKKLANRTRHFIPKDIKSRNPLDSYIRQLKKNK